MTEVKIVLSTVDVIIVGVWAGLLLAVLHAIKDALREIARKM